MERRRKGSGRIPGSWMVAGLVLAAAFGIFRYASMTLGRVAAESPQVEVPQAEAPDVDVGTPPPAGQEKWTIVIDPGHQREEDLGLEPLGPGSTVMKKKVSKGTMGTTTGIPEYAYVLEVSRLVRDLLVTEGFQVIMTREDHDVRLSNIDRAKIANAAEADLFLRIHANGADNPAIRGISTYTPPEDSPFNPEVAGRSERASQLLLEEVAKSTGAKDRGNHRSTSYTGINWSQIPVVILETGFMTNPEEDLLLATPSYRAKMARGIVKAIMRYVEE